MLLVVASWTCHFAGILIVHQSSLLTGFTSSASTHVHLERPRRVHSWSDIPRPFKLGLHVDLVFQRGLGRLKHAREHMC